LHLEQRRIKSAADPAQIVECGGDFGLELGEELSSLGIVSSGFGKTEPASDRDQLLLGAVMEVSFDPPALVVLRRVLAA